MSELACAAFAAATGSHLVDEPRSARYAAFRRGFDEQAFRADLARRAIRWLGRSDAEFPPLLRAIHDPPPGLFLRGWGTRRSSHARWWPWSGRARARRMGRPWRRRLGVGWPNRG